jgi:putative ubiquitin-RnfH superfamily antitoxin RatB of RatAB toxin-antitoxin module
MAETTIHVQVCFALPDRQFLRDLNVLEGTTLLAAIQQSGLLHDVSMLDLSVCQVGIYGKQRDMNVVLRDKDRVEIYRPLIADPKESRRQRAEKKERKNAR